MSGEATARLQADVVYLFLDGQFHAVRGETSEQEGILAAYALLEDGRYARMAHPGAPRKSAQG